MEKKKYYISTAIAYASGKPHIGNTYEIILADAIARFKRLEGYDVYFQTGTDEHGEKIENKAHAAGISPQEYVDKTSGVIKDIWDCVNTSYDAFVRTTNPEHMKVVQDIFKKYYDQGDIYLGKYEGWYCVACESFWTESQLVNGKCPDCGRDVEKKSEDAYFFKMSKYSKWLEDYINTHPDFIQPEARKNEIMNNFIKPGLQDLCVSRTSFTWGIPVSFDPKHVIYVWIDALSNYITFPGYQVNSESSDKFKKYWPADLHLIGKDILRFHTIYWPIMLHCLDLPLPKQIFGHPWLLFDNDKMSKSKGNVAYADDLVKEYGVDAVRYYALHEMPFASDGNFSIDLVESVINSDLANKLGNLVNRTLGMINKYNDGIVIKGSESTEYDDDFIKTVMDANKSIKDDMDKLRIADALDDLFNIFTRANKYIDETTPWVLAKNPEDKEKLNTVLYNLIEAIRHGAIYLQAYLPDTAESIFKQINSDDKSYESLNTFGIYKTNTKIGTPEVLFKRIEK